MKSEPHIEKVVTITDNKSAGYDFEYWQTKSFSERLEALEFLRQQYSKFINAPTRLQRVLTIVERKKS
ncbi:MAG: hypothetical protein HW421_2353 [Ignavibacteria bacterium]|nr:hypothetical protein [Ignavibacteria bacterium]